MSKDFEVGIKITADSKGLAGESRAAQDSLNNLGQAAKRTNTESAAAAERFTANLKRQADTLGMTASQMRSYDAAQLGLNEAQRASVEASNKAIQAYESQQEVMSGLRNVAIAAGAAVGVTLVAGLKASVSLAAEAEQSHLRLAAVLRGTGHAAGLTKADLDGMAESMKEKLGIDDDALRDSMAVLLTFRNISKDSFGEALETSANLAAVMQTDLKSAVLQLGKALESPEEGLTALKRSGVSFTETQKDMIKGLVDTGNQAEAITLILKTMKEKGLDAVAESMNQGITKAARDAGLAWDDLLKSIGNTSAVKGTTEGFFSGIAGSLKDLRQAVESGDWLDRLTLFATGIKTPSLIAKINAPAATDDPQARAIANEGLARQKAEQAAEISAIAKKKADEEAAKAREEASKRAVAAARSQAEAEKRAAQQLIDGAEKTIAAIRRETQEIGLNVIQKKMMSAAAEAAKAPTKELAQQIMASAQAWAMATQQQEAMMAAEKERLSAIDAIKKAEKEAAKASEASAREAAQRWNSLWGGVEQTAKSAFIQFAAHGKSAMQSIGESAKLFIIDLLYQLTARKWIINIGAVLGGVGGTGATSAGGFDLMSATNLGSSALNLVKGGFGLNNFIGTGLSKLPGAFGAFGAGMQGGSAAASFVAAESATAGAGLAAGMGSAFAAAAGPLMIAAAATAGLRAIAGDKRLGGGFGNALNAMGDIPILGDLMPVVPLVNALFGRGPLKQRETSLTGMVGADGFESGALQTDFRAKGGLFRSDKNDFARIDAVTGAVSTDNDKLQGFADQLSDYARDTLGLINDTAKQTSASLRQVGQDLGLSTDGLESFRHEINLVSEKGKLLTEEQIGQEIATITDALARKLIPEVDNLAKRGETAIQTVGRLGTEFNTLVDVAATLLGKTVADSRALVSGVSFEGRTAFIDNAGGVDALTQKAAFFAQNFLTEAERLAPVQEELAAGLQKLGLSSDLTKEQFKSLVQSYGRVNGVSEETLQALLNLAPAFVQVRDAVKSTITELAVNDAFAAVQKSVEAERTKISDRYNTEIEKANKRIQEVSESVGKLKNLSDALKSTISALRPLSRDQAKQQIQDAINAAKSGRGLPDADSLREALGVLGKSSTSGFKNSFEFAREQAKTANLVGQLGGLTDKQLSVEERSLRTLEDQRDQLEQGFKLEMQRLDSILAQGQIQVDATNGLNTSILSLTAALGQLNLKLLQTGGSGVVDPATGGVPVGGSSGERGNLINKFINSPGRTPEEVYTTSVKYGVTAEELDSQSKYTLKEINDWIDSKGLKRLSGVPGFATGGFHRGGLRIVGERGPELEATGPSRIASNHDLAKMLRNDDLTNLLKDVVVEMKAVKEFSRRTSNKLDSVTRGGNKLRTESA